MARPIRYRSLNATQTYRMRGTYQQTDTGMLWVNPTYNVTTPGGVNATNFKQRVQGIAFGFVQCTSRDTGPFIMGLGGRFPNAIWQAGTWTNATTTYTVQPNLQTSTTSQAIETASASDGFIVWSASPFNAITMNATTAETGTAPAWDFAYTGPSGWTTVTAANLTINDFQTTLIVAGEAMAMWDPPSDWTQTLQGSTLYATNQPGPGFYGVRFRATTPSGTNKLAVTGMEIALIAIQSAGPTGGLTNTSPAAATYSPVLSSAETQLIVADGIVGLVAATGVQPAAPKFGHSFDASFRDSAAS